MSIPAPSHSVTQTATEAAPETAAAKPPRRPVASEDESSGSNTATMVVAGVGSAVCLIAIGFLIWFIAGRDPWELHNAARVLATLDEAEQLEESDPFTAYKTYDQVLKEAEQHKITNEHLSGKLANAERARATLYEEVQEQIRAEEAEKERRAQEEARRAEAEKQRLAQQEERERAAEEAKKVAEAKRREEETEREKAVSKYHNAPQSARDALNVVKRLEARTEVGVNYRDYSSAVGEAWADVRVFAESPDGEAVPEFSALLVSAMAKYKLALDIWQGKLLGTDTRFDVGLSDIVLQECWQAAGRRLKAAESLLRKGDVAIGLTQAATLRKSDETYEDTIRSLFPSLIIANLSRRMKEEFGSDKGRDNFEKAANKVGEALTAVVQDDRGQETDAARNGIEDKVQHRESGANESGSFDEFGAWVAQHELESAEIKRIGDVEVALGYKFSTVYVPQNAKHILANMPTYGTFFPVGYRKADGAFTEPTAGFIPVNRKPQKIEYASSDKSIVEVFSDGSAGFRGAGKATITAQLADESISVPVTVVALPLNAGRASREFGGSATGVEEAVETLGLPDQKAEHYVSWPESREIDGIHYSPSAGRGLALQHWRYEQYPGAVISIVGNRWVWCVGTHKDE